MWTGPDIDSLVTSPGERRTRFEAVVTEVFVPLQRYLLRRAPRDAVDDLLADTLLVVWRRIEAVPTGSELPWCYGVVRKALGNHRRGAERRLRLVDKLKAQPNFPTPPPDEDNASDPAFRIALASLNEAEMELVRLWAWEELEPREIAIVLGLTPNAVSLRLTRVKQKLRTQLDRQNRDVSGQVSDKNTQEM